MEQNYNDLAIELRGRGFSDQEIQSNIAQQMKIDNSGDSMSLADYIGGNTTQNLTASSPAIPLATGANSYDTSTLNLNNPGGMFDNPTGTIDPMSSMTQEGRNNISTGVDTAISNSQVGPTVNSSTLPGSEGTPGEFLGMDSETWGDVGSGIMGAANLGMAYGSYQDAKKNNALQRKLGNQMYDSNVDTIAKNKRVSSAANAAFARR